MTLDERIEWHDERPTRPAPPPPSTLAAERRHASRIARHWERCVEVLDMMIDVEVAP